MDYGLGFLIVPSSIKLSGTFDILRLAVIAYKVAYLIVIKVLNILLILPSLLQDVQLYRTGVRSSSISGSYTAVATVVRLVLISTAYINTG